MERDVMPEGGERTDGLTRAVYSDKTDVQANIQ